MALPIIQKTGSVSGPSVAGQGSNDLVAGETVTLADLETANASATYLWALDDVALDTAPTLLNPTTSSPSFVVDADAKLAGSYRVKCTVDGIQSAIEIFSKPLINTGTRIPGFKEQGEYDGGGNSKGWQEAETRFKRAVDDALGEIKASITERQVEFSVPLGSSSQEVDLGGGIYPGSVIAVAGKLEQAVTVGSVTVNLKVGGAVKFSTVLSTVNPSFNAQLENPGDFPIVLADVITVEVVGASYANGGAVPSALVVTAVLSSNLLNAPLTIADASNTVKGLTKLSVAPTVPTEPIALAINDGRVPSQNENDALQGTSGVSSNANRFVTDSDPRNSDNRTPLGHALGGASHSVDTLANLNSKLSDATLIDTTDSRLSDARDADAIITTTGPTTLAVGAVADGEFLKRSGATVIGGVPATGPTTLRFRLIIDTATGFDSALVSLPSAMPDADYVVIATQSSPQGNPQFAIRTRNHGINDFICDVSAPFVTGDIIDFIVMETDPLDDYHFSGGS